MSGAALKAFFIEQARVGLSPGAVFGTGGSGFMRLNIGAPRALVAEALERIAAALAARQPRDAGRACCGERAGSPSHQKNQ